MHVPASSNTSFRAMASSSRIVAPLLQPYSTAEDLASLTSWSPRPAVLVRTDARSRRSDARLRNTTGSCTASASLPWQLGTLGSLAEAAAMESVRLSLSLAECDAAVLDAAAEMELSLAASSCEAPLPRSLRVNGTHPGRGSSAAGKGQDDAGDPGASHTWVAEPWQRGGNAWRDKQSGLSGGDRAQRAREAALVDDVFALVNASGQRPGRFPPRGKQSSSAPSEGSDPGHAKRTGVPPNASSEAQLHALLHSWAWGHDTLTTSSLTHAATAEKPTQDSATGGYEVPGVVGGVGRAELSNLIKALGRRGLAHWAFAVFRWMASHENDSREQHQSGPSSAGLGAAASMSSHLQQQQPPVSVPSTSTPAPNGRQQRLRPNGHTYSLILGILGRAELLEEACSVFKSFRASEFRDKVHGFNAMLAAHLRRGDAAGAWDLFEDMLQASQPHALGSPGDEVFQGKEGQGVHLRRPLSAGGPALWPRGPNAAFPVPLDRMHEWGMEVPPEMAPEFPDSGAAAARKGVAREEGSRDESRHAQAPEPDVVSFNTMIGACLHRSRSHHQQQQQQQQQRQAHKKGGAGQKEKAAKGAEAGSEVGPVLRLRQGGAEVALSLFHEMQRRRVRPNVRTFNALLGVLGRDKRWHHMEAVMEDMRAQGTPPDMFTYNVLISAHCRAHRLSDALRLYADALCEGLQATDVTLSALMSGYAAAGRTREALAAFQQLEREQSTRGLRPDTVAFCGLMAVYKEAGRADDAEKVFRRMISEGAAPNTVAYSCLIHAYGREGRLEDATRVFEEMLGSEDSTCQPDVQAFNILMAAYGQQGLSLHVARLFRSMQAHGLTPDIVSYNTLMQSFTVAGLPREAEKVLAHMLAAKCKPNSVTRGLLLRAYNNAGWHAKAEGLKRKPLHSCMQQITGAAELFA